MLLKNFTFYKYIKITSFLLQEVLPSAFQENLSKPTNLNYTQRDSSCPCSSVLYYIEYKLNQTLVWGNPLTGAECHICLKVKLSHFMHSFASEHKLSSAASTSVAGKKNTEKNPEPYLTCYIKKYMNIWMLFSVLFLFQNYGNYGSFQICHQIAEPGHKSISEVGFGLQILFSSFHERFCADQSGSGYSILTNQQVPFPSSTLRCKNQEKPPQTSSTKKHVDKDVDAGLLWFHQSTTPFANFT